MTVTVRTAADPVGLALAAEVLPFPDQQGCRQDLGGPAPRPTDGPLFQAMLTRSGAGGRPLF